MLFIHFIYNFFGVVVSVHYIIYLNAILRLINNKLLLFLCGHT